jgi:hypothetical protein
MIVAVVNHSTQITDLDAAKATRAIDAQTTEISVAWGVFSPSYVFAAAEEDVPPGAEVMRLFDDADQQGVLGYHTEGPNGEPEAYVFCRGLTPLTGSDSVSAVMSHEAGEMMVDPPCNRWAQAPDGTLYAIEISDSVEGDSYEMDVGDGPVSLSNYASPAAFDPDAPIGSQFDRMGTLKAPFTMSPGGYQITMTDGIVSQTFGDAYNHNGPRAPHKERLGSRTLRRCRK